MAKILIIDDSSFQRKWIARAVESLGHSFVEAADGQEGLEKVSSEHPDCITVDLNMPTMDGIQFLTQLDGANGKAPVIVLTADIQDETRKQCSDLGAVGFLNKPFSPEIFQALLTRCLAGLDKEGDSDRG